MCEIGLPLLRGRGAEDIVQKEIEDVTPILKRQLELAEMETAESEIAEINQ